jgi:hypothetical protein
MSRVLLRAVIGVLAAAVMACEPRDEGGAPPEAETAAVEIPSASAEAPSLPEEALPLIEEPPPDEPSPIDLEPVPGAREIVLEDPEAFEPLPAEDPYPGLEDLLRLAPVEEVEPKGPQSVEWAGQQEEEKRQEAARKKARARLDFSQENLTAGVPMQKERRRTDVGVSVPVGESERLRIKGGLRVDEREISDDEREAETAPTVGVEVRF